MENINKTPEILYRADLLRARKAQVQIKNEEITAKAVADGENMANGTITNLLKGSPNPQLRSLAVLCRILEIPLKKIFEFENEETALVANGQK